MLQIPLDQLAYIIEKAREFDEETDPATPDPGSNPNDDRDVAILEDTADNPTEQELAAALDSLDEDQRIEILALMWVGRGDFDAAEWQQALAQARDTHSGAEADYLMGTPLLADYLEAGLDALGYALDEEQDRL
ncbi:MAG TPA: DUF3775 domain-containing protein [Stellaceae bacterium]|nr:DUF3775 domain-containing protein [Stellaceae bacterium]